MDNLHFIPNTNNQYYALEDGSIVSLKRNRTKIMKTKMKDGYHLITLWIDDAPKSFRVNRLVYSAFNGIIPDNKVIDHINHDRSDNRISNLQLLSPRDNVLKAWRAGRTDKTIEACKKNGKALAKGFVKQSGIPCVYYANKNGKWFGVKYIEGKRFNTKHTDTPEEARDLLVELLP